MAQKKNILVNGVLTPVWQTDATAQEIDDAVAAASGAVRYDAAQSLTEAQQKQARENIASAEGFKSIQMIGAPQNITAISEVGWYRLCTFNKTLETALIHVKHSWNNGGPSDLLFYVDPGIYSPRVSILAYNFYKSVKPVDNARLTKNSDGSVNFDFHYTLSAANAVGCDIIASSGSQLNQCAVDVTTFPPTAVADEPENETILTTAEWSDPPLVLGVEYRTTERFLDKPVYAKLVNFGSLPASSSKSVAHGAENVSLVVGISGHSNGENLVGNPYIDYCNVGATDIVIKTNADRSAVGAYIVIHYTKSTD